MLFTLGLERLTLIMRRPTLYHAHEDRKLDTTRGRIVEAARAQPKQVLIAVQGRFVPIK